MFARNVKSGMLIRDEAGIWQVVIGRRRKPCDPLAPIFLEFANGSETEYRDEKEKIETVRLTHAQVTALGLAAAADVYRAVEVGVWRWKMVGAWQPLRAAAYDRISALKLISTADRMPTRREDYALTINGQALLDHYTAVEFAALEATREYATPQ